MATINGAQVLYYVQSGELIWAITEDGHWLPIDASQLADNIVIHFISAEQIQATIDNGQTQLIIDGESVDITPNVLNSLSQARQQLSTPNNFNHLDIDQQGSNFGFQLVSRNEDINFPNSGFDTNSDNLPQRNSEPNSSQHEDSFPTLILTVKIDANGDAYVNRFESSAVDISGQAIGARDGQLLTLTLTDAEGEQLLFQVSVIDQTWLLTDIDWTGLSEGLVTAEIAAPLYPGETENGLDDTIKDTLAKLTINIDYGTDDIVNAQEATAARLFGNVSNIQDNQAAMVTISDALGRSQTLSTQIINGQWQVTEIDLSLFDSTSLTANVISTDLAGNSASASIRINADIAAEITIAFVDADGVLNQKELTNASLQGEVFDIEDGQTVSISFSDASDQQWSIDTIVVDGGWSIQGIDLSQFDSRTLQATAYAIDLAGNPAQASTSILIDNLADISIEVDAGDDDVINAAEMSRVTIFGGVTDIEDGQTVTVIVTDVNGKALVFTTTVMNQAWQLTDTDLSSLAEGELYFSATSMDVAGNPVQAQVSYLKDSLASITIEFIDSDGVLNQQELANASLQGKVFDIEDGQTVTISFSDAGGQQWSTSTIVANGGWFIQAVDLSQFDSQTLQATVTSADQAGNPAQASTNIAVDDNAEITINVDSGEDTVLNAIEVLATDLFGTVRDIEDGQQVTITVTDSTGQSLSFSTLVVNQSWTLNDVDLSALSDGPLVFNASSSDIAGNIATATIDAYKETQAFVSINAIDADQILNSTEVANATLAGIVHNIEDGRSVLVTVTDSLGNRLAFTAIISNGIWQIDDVDLSSLADGELQLFATSSDFEGNFAQNTSTVIKDTQASIDIEIIDDNGLINAQELSRVSAKGSVSNIEDGQQVSVSFTDQFGNTVTITTTVVAGQWLVDNVDLSGLVDGPLSAHASVMDFAGNTTEAETSAQIDTLASIDIFVETGSDTVINQTEVFNTNIYGVVDNIEDGQIVTIIARDIHDAELRFEAQIVSGQWQVLAADLSSLAEGPLSFIATTTDDAGNQANAETDVIKETQATITIAAIDANGILNSLESETALLAGFVLNVEDSSPVLVTVTDAAGNRLTFESVVFNGIWRVKDADLSSLVDGTLQLAVQTQDFEGNVASASNTVEKDSSFVEVTIQIETGNDNTLNQFETPLTTIFGRTFNIENGQTVDITVTDINGQQLSFETTVTDNRWQLDNLDLSSLADGAITATATVTDIAGNPAQASDVKNKNVIAEIDFSERSSDQTLSADTVSKAIYFGTSQDIENGQQVNLTFTDSAGNSVSFNSIVVLGRWLFTDLDLSSLGDGDISVTIDATDRYGNLASQTTLLTKDTQASITIDFTDNDNLINANEITATGLSGTVVNVEDGQTVTIIISDGTTELSYTANIVNGLWQLNDVDLSSLNDGNITATATVTDIAGNEAQSATNITLDTQASISLKVDTNQDVTDNTLNAIEVSQVTLSGTTTDVDNNSQVIVTVVDIDGLTLTFTTTVLNNNWQINAADLSSLTDGELTVTATTIDTAGNNAAVAIFVTKDTQAQLSLAIESGDDKLVSTAELINLSVSGDSNNIEAGQVVTVVISDSTGTSVTRTATIDSNGKWSIPATDFAALGFVDGVITATATATDLAGNPATAIDTATIDTQVSIDIDTGEDGFNAALFIYQLQKTISGTSSGVEADQDVTLTISDGITSLTFVTQIANDGSWVFNDLDTSTLNKLQPWEVNVGTQDQAGNNAIDELPTLVQPHPALLFELLLNFQSSTSVDVPFAINNADVSISLDQSKLETLTSEGQAITATIAADGQSFILTRADGQTVMEGLLNNGKLQVSLSKPLDETSEVSTTTYIRLEALQTDLDGTQEKVLTYAVLTITDTFSYVADDHYTVTEDTTSSGSLIGNDYTIEGPLTVTRITIDNVDYQVNAGIETLINTAYGQLSVSSNGVWQFVANDNLNHTTSQQLNFVYHAEDIDGTPGSASVSIDIVDGSPGVAPITTATTDETVINTSNQQSQQFTIQAGSDTVLANSVAFGSLTPFNLANLGLSSNGLQINYSLSADGKTLTAFTSSPSITIFTVSLSAVNSGDDVNVTAVLNLFRPLDHNVRDIINLAMTVTAEDLDGTPVNKGLLNWAIDDGSKISFDNIGTLSFDENNVSATPIAKTASFDLLVGSDAVQEVRFDTINLQPKLTVANQTIIYQLSADGLTLTAHTGDDSDPVFVIQLSNTWNTETNSLNQDYTFTLYKAFDQNNNDSFDFAIYAKDFDDDITQATLSVTVQDADAASIDDINLTVSEDPSINAFDNQDSGLFNISASKDPIVNALFSVSSGDEVQNRDGTTLTYNGSKLYWSLSDAGATAEAKTAEGKLVFTISLPTSVNIDAESTATLAIDFDLKRPIDHLNSADLLETLEVGVNVIDSDNTVTSGSVTITIYDGVNPTLPDALTLNLNEAGLVISNPISTSQVLETLAGSDDIASIELANGFSLAPLYSAGHLVSLTSAVNSNGWYVATRAGDNQKVFQIKFNSNGKVEFKQFLPIDHDFGDNGNNILGIDFNVIATDADGDNSNSQTVTVNITDSIPQDTTRELTFTEANNESYSISLFSSQEQGADGAVVTQIDYPGGPYYPGDVIDLMTDANPTAVKYGELVINADGTATVQTLIFDYAAPSYSEDIIITFMDADGDIATSTLTLTARDAEGSIKIFTTDFVEDTTSTVAIQASPGDLDDGELITSIVFDTAALAGGILALNGTELTKDGSGNYVLQGSDLLINSDGTAIPNGNLTYTPTEDASDATVSASFDVTVNIQGKGPVESSVAINIESVADTPIWDADSQFSYDIFEDSDAIPLDIGASSQDQTGVDAQGSETLTYIIDNISTGLTLQALGLTITNGTSLSQVQLDAITMHVGENLAGEFSFTVQAQTTEIDNRDTALSSIETVTVNVTPVADTPSVSARDIRSVEDQAIALKDIVSGQLSDTSGSESLSFEFTLPAGWSLQGPSAIDLGGGIWTISAEDVDNNNAWLIPLEDASSANQGEFSISVRSFATESSQAGIDPENDPTNPNPAYSDSESLTIKLSGVANDAPSIIDNQGNWSIDNASNTISNLTQLNEDQDIALDFTIVSSDIDGSESLDLRLSGVPDGVIFVDANGIEVQLDVVGFDNAQPIYAVSASQLSTLSLRPVTDFSGRISLTILAQSTELDGDSNDYQMTLNIDISPVIDANTTSLTTQSSGREDQAIALNLTPNMLADIDGSESVVGVIIPAQVNGLILLLDGVPVIIDPSGLDLIDLTDSTSPTLDALINSGRLAVLPPEDADGFFDFAVQYQVQDISDTGEITTNYISSQVSVYVDAVVDLATNLQSEKNLLTSSDGSAIDLTNQVIFNEQDIDGSEVLDYVVIIVPDSDGWYVEHPNGAINDGGGRWIIPVNGLTNDTTQEWALSILDGAKISSELATGLEKIVVEARVLDRDDADIISTQFYVQFEQGAGNSDATNVNTLQLTPVDTIEDNTISFAGHLNSNITNDMNDIISFKIKASDLPEGGYFSGVDVTAVYDDSGLNVIEYVFTSQSLASLSLHNISENYAGDLTIPITIIATDSISGDTKIDNSQSLDINITPVVDGSSLDIANSLMFEDQPIPLGISFSFADQDASPNTGGQEQLVITDPTQPITLTLLDGGTISDPTGYWVAVAGSNNSWQFKGFTQADLDAALGLLEFVPPINLSGDFRIQLSGTVADIADIDGNLVTTTDTFSSISTITVLPVVDAADTPSSILNFIGAEDSDIDLSGLSSSDLALIDKDGSEVIYLTIQGVPEGAVLYYQNGGSLIQLPNNGEDGGSFSGQPTYSWSVTEAQLATLVMRPPLDFNGDIPLTVQAITQELGTDQFATTTTELIVGVSPVADGVQIIQAPDPLYNSIEDEVISIDLSAEILDTSGDELIQIVITVTSEQASALVDLDGIAIGDRFSAFTYNAAEDSYSAKITTNSASLSQFELHPGPLAFGSLNVQVDVSSVDAEIVLGTPSFDTSSVETAYFDIEIAPQVDRPIWTHAEDIIATDPNNVALNLGLELQNPAATETGLLTLFGLPDHLALSKGNKVGNKWLVSFDDVADLTVIGASDGDSFTLFMEPLATYEGDVALGVLKIISVTIDSTATVNSIDQHLGHDEIIYEDMQEVQSIFQELNLSSEFSHSAIKSQIFNWITPILLTPQLAFHAESLVKGDHITPVKPELDSEQVSLDTSLITDLPNQSLMIEDVAFSISEAQVPRSQHITPVNSIKGDHITPIKPELDSEQVSLDTSLIAELPSQSLLAENGVFAISETPVALELLINPANPIKGDHISPILPSANISHDESQLAIAISQAADNLAKLEYQVLSQQWIADVNAVETISQLEDEQQLLGQNL